MHAPQPGILAPLPAASRYISLRVRAGADPMATALTNFQHPFRSPIHRRLLGTVVVDRQVDPILVAKPFNHVERFRGRLGDKGLDTHLSTELEDLAATFLVAGNRGIE